MKSFASLALAAVALPLSLSLIGCMDDKEAATGPSGGATLAGSWEFSESTIKGFGLQKDSVHSTTTFTADGKYNSSVEGFDWDDEAGKWIPDGTIKFDGTYSFYPESGNHILIDERVTVGANTYSNSEILFFDLNRDTLTTFKAAILKGTSDELVGKWTSILDSAKIDLRINKIMWSFEATADGKFKPAFYDGDELAYHKTPEGFTVTDDPSSSAPPTFRAYPFRSEIKNKTLYLRYLDESTPMRRVR